MEVSLPPFKINLPNEPVDVDEPLVSFPSDINKSPPEVNVVLVVLFSY